jgi:hypothetical protein
MNGLDLEFRQHSITSQQQKSRITYLSNMMPKKHRRLSRANLSPTNGHAHFENEAKHKNISARCVVRENACTSCALSKESASEDKIPLF